MRKVWLLHDNKQGHIQQLKGLADRLEAHNRVTCCFYHYQAIPSAANHTLSSEVPSMVIGAGHKTHWQVLRHSRKYRAMSCVLMTPSLPKSWFDAIIAPEHDQLTKSPNIHSTHILSTQGPLNRVIPDKQSPRDLNLILLGGKSKHFHWNDEQILSQLETILRENPEQVWHYFVSRRTPASCIEKLHQLKSEQLIFESKPLYKVLSRAAKVWLSPDSSSMLYEALSAGAQVSTLTLREKKRAFKRSKIAQHHELLIRDGRISSFENRHKTASNAHGTHVLWEADSAARWLLSRHKTWARTSISAPNKPLHVLQVLPALEGGGVERGTLEIAQALEEHHIASSIASSGGALVAQVTAHKAKQRETHGAISGAIHNNIHSSINDSIDSDTHHYTLNLASKSPWTILKNAFLLSRLVKAKQVSLIHVRSRAPAWSCLLASKLSGVPYISTFHGQYGHSFALKKLYNSAMLRGRACIAVSPFIEAHIRSEYPNLAGNIQLISRGIDPSYFNPALCPKLRVPFFQDHHSSASEPKSEPRPEPKPTIFFPARFTRLKGHALIIDAVSKLRAPKLRIVFAGKQANRKHFIEELKANISKRQLDHEFLFLDTLEDPRSAYCSADIVISASEKPEAFGRIIAEAQAMKCLVLAANHGAAPEVLAPCLREGLFAPNDADDLARALKFALNLEVQQKTQVLNEAQKYVYQNFTLESMCQKTITVYKDLALSLGSTRS
jgi:glycosyltransferase involved in cell wall biosynthesis/mitochondrial fission protein ELM1